MTTNQNCASSTGIYTDRDCIGPYKKKYRLTSFNDTSSSTYPNTTALGLNCTNPASASDAAYCVFADGFEFYEPDLNEKSTRLPGVVATNYDFSGFRMVFDLTQEYDFHTTLGPLLSDEYVGRESSRNYGPCSFLSPSSFFIASSCFYLSFSFSLYFSLSLLTTRCPSIAGILT